MISVVIPLMPIEPYKTQVLTCLDSIRKQDADFEVIISEHPIEKYISKNVLLNNGIEIASGEYVFLCDADFILEDKTLLKRMQESGYDVVFPMFESETHGQMKISDGGVFAKKKVLKRFGEFDESLVGISWVTFPFLSWCLDNAKWHCSEDFTIKVDQTHKSRKKRHNGTSAKMRPIYKKVVKELKKKGVWP